MASGYFSLVVVMMLIGVVWVLIVSCLLWLFYEGGYGLLLGGMGM